MRLFCSVRSKLLAALCLAVTLFFSIEAYLAWVGDARANIERPWVIDVARGAGWGDVVRTLTAERVYHAPWGMRAYIWYLGYTKQLKRGEYDLLPHEPWRSLVGRLVSGKVKQYTLTILPGESWVDLHARLRALPLTDWDALEAFQLPSLEGYFYPESYFFARSSSVSTVLSQARARFMASLQAVWEGRDPALQAYSASDLVIIASLIEREAQVDVDRKKIARVIYNRLAIGMPLQIDASMVYVVRALGRSLRRQDLQEVHPYNTYRIPALPPGPIAYPSLDSLEAAAHPEVGDWLYYRLGCEGRAHLFSRSFEEHTRKAQGCRP